MTIKVTVSYSHKDDRFRKELETTLSTLEESCQIVIWHDNKITPGVDFAEEIERQFDSSDLVLLLVSPDYLASRFCYRKEMAHAIQRDRCGLSRVVPIIVRPCDWQSTPLEKLKVLPSRGRPITKWANKDDAWLDVLNGIKQVLTELKSTEICLSRAIYDKSVANWDRWISTTRGLRLDLARKVKSAWAQRYLNSLALPSQQTSFRNRLSVMKVANWDLLYKKLLQTL